MCNNPPSTAVASITGGSLTTGGIILAYGGSGQITGGTGTMTIGGNAAVTTPRLVMVGYSGNTSSSPSLGTLNLDGGTLTTGYVGLKYNPFNRYPPEPWGTGVFNFNGGVLQAAAASAGTFMCGLSAAYVQVGRSDHLHQLSLRYHQPGPPARPEPYDHRRRTDQDRQRHADPLRSANTFNGPTTVRSGTLTAGHPLALQNSTVNSSGGGAISITAPSPTFGGLTGSGNLTVPSGTLSVGNNGSSTTL